MVVESLQSYGEEWSYGWMTEFERLSLLNRSQLYSRWIEQDESFSFVVESLNLEEY